MAKKWRKWQAENKLKYPAEWKIWCGLLQRQYLSNYQLLQPLWDQEIVGCFETFLAEIGGHRPGPGYSVDRVNNSKGYVKGNLRWATAKTQARNSRKLKWEYQGRPLVEECEKRGIKINSVLARINKFGWRVEEALNTPFKIGNNQLSTRILGRSDTALEHHPLPHCA